MQYWWVNHKQTSKHEIPGGYIWSPKRERNGNRSQYYDYMGETRPGDLILSFSDSIIGHWGEITAFPISARIPPAYRDTPKPWSDIGWRVSVKWRQVPTPVRPKAHLNEIAPLLPDKYAPIQYSTGNGIQKAYLTKIGQALFDLVASRGNFSPQSTGNDDADFFQASAIDEIEGQIESEIASDPGLNETEKQALFNARIGQGKFKQNVQKIENKCRVTNLQDPRLLIASHIRPWRLCESANHRLSGHNGLLLAPHIDKLFDRGLLSFGDDGQILIASTISQDSLEKLGLADIRTKNAGPFTQQQREHLAFHRENIFIST